MATQTITISLGSALAGLTLRGQLVDSSGVNYGDPITTGFVELSGGHYLLSTDIPATLSGAIKIYQSGTPLVILATASINPPSVPVVSIAGGSESVAGPQIIFRRGDYSSLIMQSLTNLSARTKLWFTLKSKTSDPDQSALIMVEETGGLLRLNGSPTTSAYASISVTDLLYGEITLVIDARATSLLAPATNLFYDLQMLTSSGPVTLTSGIATVTADVTRAIS